LREMPSTMRPLGRFPKLRVAGSIPVVRFKEKPHH
jgi:hypothetical protein